MNDMLRSISTDFDRRAGALRRSVSNELRFVRGWFQAPLRTGAIAASGRALAKRMAAYVDPAIDGPVLELGPGTGNFTRALIKAGISEDRLWLVEANPDFARHLRQVFPRATLILGDAYQPQTWRDKCPAKPFTAIVSGLPLLTQPRDKRRSLISECLDLSRPGASFIQFTYRTAPPLPGGHGLTARPGPVTFYNLPPARIWLYSKTAKALPVASL
ncbi:MAG: methyltransferase domain-containing protein [Rhodobiaceae bacterium]|nr:methyltransferase domain-containing protein [Rhodobiaceae bacterium]MCC0055412.1 methyltransferase domain-containing protein [Rhodobiaceae bacterium]